MDKNEILNQLTIIFKKIFENDAVILQMDTTANDVDGWDSLTHTSMIVEVEKHFSVKFKLKEVFSKSQNGIQFLYISGFLHSFCFRLFRDERKIAALVVTRRFHCLLCFLQS